MKGHIFYTAGHTDALNYATADLLYKGCSFVSEPDCTVTHLLLGVPSFEPDGSLKGGGRLESILPELSKNIIIVGGNLHHPALTDYSTVDILQDNLYLAENAGITAHCAVSLAMQKLPITLDGCHALVIGWGRIGKCLAALLRNMGAIVTVAARREADRAMLLALGYDAVDTAKMDYSLLRYRVIFNTAPTMVLPKKATVFCSPDCLKIDLASMQGIEADDVLWARGLPNKDAPQSSGKLIARTILRLI